MMSLQLTEELLSYYKVNHHDNILILNVGDNQYNNLI